MDVHIPFSTSYLCESAFSTLNYIKNKNRSELENLDENLRVGLQKKRPRKRCYEEPSSPAVSLSKKITIFLCFFNKYTLKKIINPKWKIGMIFLVCRDTHKTNKMCRGLKKGWNRCTRRSRNESCIN